MTRSQVRHGDTLGWILSLIHIFCGLIPESIHMRVMADKGPEMTNGEYLTTVFTAHLAQPTTAKQDQRTLAVQISEDMFQPVSYTHLQLRSTFCTRRCWTMVIPPSESLGSSLDNSFCGGVMNLSLIHI